MAEHDHRQLSRDSLFLMADVRVGGEDLAHKIRVRNLSAGGMMAEGSIGATRGAAISVHIRNIGWVAGEVAWVQGDRCGIAFAEDIDPIVARAPVTVGDSTPRYVKPPIGFAKERVRKV